MRRVSRIILVAFTLATIGGIGFALGVCWHTARQFDVWNDAALPAILRRAYLEGDTGHQSPVLIFELENHLGRDYAIREPSDVQSFVRYQGALSADAMMVKLLEIELPVVIPAGDKGLLILHFHDAVEPEQPTAGDAVAVKRFLAEKKHLWNHFDSVVLLDERYHCRITLPTADLQKNSQQ